MKAGGFILAAAVVLSAAPARAEQYSAVAIDSAFMAGVSVAHGRLDRPSSIGGGRSARSEVWARLRGGHLGQVSTALGSNFGADWEVAAMAGWDDGPGDRSPFGVALGVDLTFHPFSFRAGGTEGLFVARFGAELASGGAYWWSDTARLAPRLGGRLILGREGGFGLELGYLFLPHVITGSPGELSVARSEHRAELTGGLGKLGLGLAFGRSEERARLGGGPLERTSSFTFAFILELRVPE